jgi:chemotaxis protein methyltransferase WspC
MSRPGLIAELLARAIGLDASILGPTLLDRAIQRRMRALGLTDPGAYTLRVRSDPDELDELAEELAVPETWFFRDAAPFERLREFATDWVREPRRPSLRVLSLACATGEEPYSIAMALTETGLGPGRFRILGVDLSARVLDVARRASYAGKSLRGVDPARLKRYFIPDGDRQAVAPELRRAVQFQRGNLIDPELLADEPPFDVILCRNVLIYLTTEAREQVLRHVRRLLAPSGLLFLGHADRSATLGGEFLSAGGFAFQRRGDSPIGGDSPVVVLRDPPRRTMTAPVTPRTRAGAKQPARAVAAPAPPVERPPLERAAEHAGRGEYGPAKELCELSLRRNGPSAPAFHLLGVIAQARGDDEQAEHWLGKAVFLDASHDEALLALALLARKRGDHEGAARYRRRADRARKGREAP